MENKPFCIRRTYESKSRKKKRVTIPQSVIKQVRRRDGNKPAALYNALFLENIKKLKVQDMEKENIHTYSNYKFKNEQINHGSGKNHQYVSSKTVTALQENNFDDLLNGPCYQPVSYKSAVQSPCSSVSSDELNDTLFIVPRKEHKTKEFMCAPKTSNYKPKLPSFDVQGLLKPKQITISSAKDLSMHMKNLKISSSQKQEKETSTPILHRSGLPRFSERLNISPIVSSKEICKGTSSSSPIQMPLEYQQHRFLSIPSDTTQIPEVFRQLCHSPIQGRLVNKEQTSLWNLEDSEISIQNRIIRTPIRNVRDCEEEHSIVRNFMHDDVGKMKQCYLSQFHMSPDMFTSITEIHVDNNFNNTVVEQHKHANTSDYCCHSMNSKVEVPSEGTTNMSTSIYQIPVMPVELNLISSECISEIAVNESNVHTFKYNDSNLQLTTGKDNLEHSEDLNVVKIFNESIECVKIDTKNSVSACASNLVNDGSIEKNLVNESLSLQPLLASAGSNSQSNIFESVIENSDCEIYKKLEGLAPLVLPGMLSDTTDTVMCSTSLSTNIKVHITEVSDSVCVNSSSINGECIMIMEKDSECQTEGNIEHLFLDSLLPTTFESVIESGESVIALTQKYKDDDSEKSKTIFEVNDDILVLSAMKTDISDSALENCNDINNTLSTVILERKLPHTDICLTRLDPISKMSGLSLEATSVHTSEMCSRHGSLSQSSLQSCEKHEKRGSCHGRCKISAPSTTSWARSRLSHKVVVPTWSVRASQGFRDVFISCRSEFSNIEDSLSTIDYASSSVVDKSEVQLVLTARDVVLLRCNQTAPLLFAESMPDCNFENCKKIGEGVYGEVFSCENPNGHCTVLKIIPIEGTAMVNGEAQKSFEDILSEIVIAMELSNLRHGTKFQTHGFGMLERCWCVKGRYPSRLLELWHQFDTNKGSENDCPDMFLDDQLYIILELAHGGTDLEAFIFNSAEQALSVFFQVAYTLAVAEGALEFEHRDLHWGNILIAPTTAKSVMFCLNGTEYTVLTKGVQVAVIDFTLSRMLYDECCIYNDLSQDPSLFQSLGDYQFDVYRHMQTRVQDQWDVFEPYTNVLWMHYILGKMISGVHYRRKTTKVHKKFIQKLSEFWESMLDYASATAFVNVQKL